MATNRINGACAPGLIAPVRAGLPPGCTTPAAKPALHANQESESHESAALDDDRKAVLTMMALAVQAGCTLHELAGGGYLVCRWSMVKELPTLRAVGDLLRRIGSAV